MKLRFHPSARLELKKATDYYEETQEGLGWEFLAEVQDAIKRIMAFPNAWRSLSARTRRCLTARFPYSIIYQLRSNEIRIIAIAHQSRKPEYWKRRL